MKTLMPFFVAAAVAVVSGCGGGGGGSSSNPAPTLEKPTDLWEGVTYDLDGGESETTCLVTPLLELRCVNDEGQELLGPAARRDLGNHHRYTWQYTWADPMGRGQAAPSSGEGQLDCEFVPHQLMECEFRSQHAHGPFAGGSMMLYQQALESAPRTALLGQRVRQAEVAGQWAPRGEGDASLSIDGLGRVFGQSAATGCVLNGHVRLRSRLRGPVDFTGEDPGDLAQEGELPSQGLEPLNLFGLRLRIAGCTDPDFVAYNGTLVTGYAWLDRTQVDKDTLVAIGSVEGPEGHAAFSRRYRRQ
jgi:hypothetical protein